MADAAWLKEHVRDVPDFPRRGVVFKDISPLLASPDAFSAVVSLLARTATPESGAGEAAGRRAAGIDKVVGIEARGFIIAAPVAVALGAGFVPVRKRGKLPSDVERITYELEYGSDTLEIHRDALTPGERVLVIDDVLATGGTAAATAALVEALGASVVALGFVIELAFLRGRERLGGYRSRALLTYD